MMFSYCIFKYVYWANKKIEKYNDKLQGIKDRRKFYENKTYLYFSSYFFLQTVPCLK